MLATYLFYNVLSTFLHVDVAKIKMQSNWKMLATVYISI